MNETDIILAKTVWELSEAVLAAIKKSVEPFGNLVDVEAE